MSQSLSWKKKKQEGECPEGIAGMIFGSLIGVILLFIESAFFRGMFLGRFYNFVLDLLPNVIQSIIPNWFIWIFFGLLGMFIGLIIDLGSGK